MPHHSFVCPCCQRNNIVSRDFKVLYSGEYRFCCELSKNIVKQRGAETLYIEKYSDKLNVTGVCLYNVDTSNSKAKVFVPTRSYRVTKS